MYTLLRKVIDVNARDHVYIFMLMYVCIHDVLVSALYPYKFIISNIVAQTFQLYRIYYQPV